MTKDVKFFAASIFAHIIVLVSVVLLSNFHVQEEEVVLTLDLSEPMQSEQKTEQVQTPQKTEPPIQKKVENAIPTPSPTPIPVVAEKQVSQPVSQPVVAQTQPKQATPKADIEKEYLDFHLQAIRKLLSENRKYPRNARVLGQEGDVEVSFRLNGDGSVDDISIVKGSGFELLDNAARELIASTAKLFPKPPKSVRVRVPLKYALQ
jgi:periplasmic protein TonB